MEVPLGNYDGPLVGADRQPCPMSAHGQRLSTVRCFDEDRTRCIAYAGKASAPELSTSQKSPSAAAGISTASPQIPPRVAKQSCPKILQYATKHLEPSVVCHFLPVLHTEAPSAASLLSIHYLLRRLHGSCFLPQQRGSKTIEPHPSLRKRRINGIRTL